VTPAAADAAAQYNAASKRFSIASGNLSDDQLASLQARLRVVTVPFIVKLLLY